MSYDVTIICFSNPLTDARTINLVKTLQKFKRKVLLITPTYDISPDYLVGESKYMAISLNKLDSLKKKSKVLKKEVAKLKIDTRYVLASDLYSLQAANYIYLKRKASFIYDSREIYSKLASKNDSPLKQKLIEIFEKYYVTNVSKVIVTSEDDELYLKKHFQSKKEFHVIKNFPLKKDIIESNKLKLEYKIPDESTLFLYQGWILEGRGLVPFIEAISELENCYLVIIGDGTYLKILKNLVKELSLSDRVFFKGLVEYDKLHEYTCSADVGISLFEPISTSYEYALPNKLFEYMMAGLPVLATDLISMRKVVSESKNGILVKDIYNKEELKESIIKLMNRKTREKYEKNSIEASAKYSYEEQELEILKVFP